MEPLMVNDVWYGKDQTPYEVVPPRIDAVTSHNIQVLFDRTVS
jgi:hypothetical protein